MPYDPLLHNDCYWVWQNMSRIVRKQTFCICENKDADQLRGNRKANQRLCFRYIVQSLYFLNMKFQASSYLVWLYSLVCVGPGPNEAHIMLKFKFLVNKSYFAFSSARRYIYEIVDFQNLSWAWGTDCCKCCPSLWRHTEHLHEESWCGIFLILYKAKVDA